MDVCVVVKKKSNGRNRHLLPPASKPHTATVGACYSDALHLLAKPTHKLEVCMTDLAPEAAAPFFRDPAKKAAQVWVGGWRVGGVA